MMVTVTLSNGRVIRLETDDTEHEASGSYAIDDGGVLMIESRQVKSTGEIVVTRQRYSPAAWQCVEHDHAIGYSDVPPWTAGVIGSGVLSGQR
ncbi:hypothetical protein MHAE_07654 [Mycobacterium haemophilum DSM 44634]|uniref:Uncharacterized protein n=1 Tax=Mycobacterium haemophilum TaxID=29311 RepID=A0A0I9YG52_9MYCO|nr:hypothetical protein [Mycobacterium haemophilum]KLO33399.1 hypothetical protein ABH39_00610 [Mycobacterium haemophilum]KLO38922.1 hypothetical protein ABH38_00610 [Mycobacterium haemophilum]KLO45340.1 hypothetical protein ABH37_00610 [Mycobacterium haemophilum]KLO56489.1 hypothetical protein ABH36_00610 [Mycobacterium haemophilum]